MPQFPKPTNLAKCLLAVLLCLGVLMQMLGVPTTLWAPGNTLDLYGASVFTGYAIPPLLTLQSDSLAYARSVDQEETGRESVFDHSLYHPPILAS
jgi:hypothetical protein